MKKIALFGATGKTGKEFLTKALQAEYDIKALVRDPQKLTTTSDKLQIIQGDVLDQNAVDATVEGTDMVVSLFGHVKGSPEWLQTNGTKNIIASMQTHKVNKIISLSGGGLPYPEKDRPRFPDKVIRLIMKIAVPKILNDAIEHHRVLKESGLKWTIVRAPRLTVEPERGNYRVGWVGVNASTKVGRADLADFILKQINNEDFNYQLPFISY